MPKDRKRNIQNYQLRGGHLNEYAFQKSQGEMVQESVLPFNDEIDKPNLAQATKRMADVTAKAHRIVEQRKTRRPVKSAGRKNIVSAKRSAKKSTKKIATKSAKKTTSRPGTKKRTSTAAKRSGRKVAMKSSQKATTRAGTKKRQSVKTKPQNRAYR